jgi:WD40 repeat protein
MPLTSLHNDAWALVFRTLDEKALARCARVCHAWHEIIEDSAQWVGRLRDLAPLERLPTLPASPEVVKAALCRERRIEMHLGRGTCERTTLARGLKPPLTSLAFSGDSAFLSAGQETGTLGLWSTDDGARVDAPSDGPRQRVVAQAGGVMVRELDMEDIGRHRLEVTHADGVMLPLVWTLDARPVAVALSAHGGHLAVSAADGSLWVQKTGEPFGPRCLCRGRGEAAAALCLSPDGRRLLAASWLEAEVRLWDLEGDPEAPPVKRPNLRVTEATFAPSGDAVALACAKGYVRLVHLDPQGGIGRVETLGRLRTLPQACVRALTFSSDGRYLFAAYGKRVLVRDRRRDDATWVRITAQNADGMAANLARSTDGRFLAVEWDAGSPPAEGQVQILDFVGR